MYRKKGTKRHFTHGQAGVSAVSVHCRLAVLHVPSRALKLDTSEVGHCLERSCCIPTSCEQPGIVQDVPPPVPPLPKDLYTYMASGSPIQTSSIRTPSSAYLHTPASSSSTVSIPAPTLPNSICEPDLSKPLPPARSHTLSRPTKDIRDVQKHQYVTGLVGEWATPFSRNPAHGTLLFPETSIA
jgi:hypothetical protein